MPRKEWGEEWGEEGERWGWGLAFIEEVGRWGWGWGWTSWKEGECGRTSWEGVGFGWTLAGKDDYEDELAERMRRRMRMN